MSVLEKQRSRLPAALRISYHPLSKLSFRFFFLVFFLPYRVTHFHERERERERTIYGDVPILRPAVLDRSYVLPSGLRPQSFFSSFSTKKRFLRNFVVACRSPLACPPPPPPRFGGALRDDTKNGCVGDYPHGSRRYCSREGKVSGQKPRGFRSGSSFAARIHGSDPAMQLRRFSCPH